MESGTLLKGVKLTSLPFPIPIELDDTMVLAIPMAVAHEDVAVLRNHDVSWLIKQIRPGTRHAGLSEGHEHLAFRAEFENLMSLATFTPSVRDPQVAAAID